eukprot:NODE_2276_length_1225_cov_23.708561_g2164_i0.p2 GENE.NODE_2276_length_1225_cov_23.708561_g2164_i0~~NODE_2276_length_1225_cov_23.708561_g2164_i0.p2  ORF type:complete len:242 (-),score=38.57 NODE_2276_length_1225_cov_23.708561_g2164_i0:48-773(-)
MADSMDSAALSRTNPPPPCISPPLTLGHRHSHQTVCSAIAMADSMDSAALSSSLQNRSTTLLLQPRRLTTADSSPLRSMALNFLYPQCGWAAGGAVSGGAAGTTSSSTTFHTSGGGGGASTSSSQRIKAKDQTEAKRLDAMDGIIDGLYKGMEIEIEGGGIYRCSDEERGRRVSIPGGSASNSGSAAERRGSATTTKSAYKVPNLEAAIRLDKMDGTVDGKYKGQDIDIEGVGIFDLSMVP